MKLFSLNKFYLFFSSVFLFVLHIPFVFAKSRPDQQSLTALKLQPIAITDTALQASPLLAAQKMSLYDSLRLGSMGLARQAFDLAIQGLNLMKEMGKLENYNIISIVDFSKRSSQKRLFVIDLQHCKVLFNTYVAHGQNSGQDFANRFSNVPDSYQSSLGFYETQGTYVGGNGYSLRLQGMERGINDNAMKRDIVMHGADYVDESLIRAKGCIGRSWGCPAVPLRQHKAIINKIRNGTCLFIYSPDKNYLSHSKIVQQREYAVTGIGRS